MAVFLGALAYADDIVLLASTPAVMRAMLAVCDNYTDDLHIVFNANKSKCLYIGPRSKLPYWYSTAIIEFVVTRDELVYAICHVHCFSFFPFFSFMYLVYDFNNKYI